MLNPIKRSLEISINRAGIERQIEAVRICQYWQEVVEIIFSKEVSEKSQAIKFHNGALIVAVLNPVFAQEFKFKEEEIIEEMNKKVGKCVVRKIRFEL